MENPSTETVKTAFLFVKALTKQLEGEGFKVVGEPCQECLRLDINFGSGIVDPDRLSPVIVIYAGVRVFYKNNEVLIARDDSFGGRKMGALFSREDEIAKGVQEGALTAAGEFEQAWRIAILGQKISMAQ